jgi:hypothetical protein
MSYEIKISVQELNEAGLDYNKLKRKLEEEDTPSTINKRDNKYHIENIPITLFDLKKQGVSLICDTMWEFKAERIVTFLRSEAIQYFSLKKIRKLEDLTI